MRTVTWSEVDETTRAELLSRGTAAAGPQVTSGVADILEGVREGGDAALQAYAERFDRAPAQSVVVGQEEIARAAAELPEALRTAITDAATNIRTFHRAGMTVSYEVETAPGVICARVVRPIRRVGLYVPAGSAPLPSTALMLGVPAQLAGCPEVVLCTPPGEDGRADPTVLAAAAECGITRVFVTGGAQAIAAMAYGTESVPRCDKIFGPGNAWVTEAKRQVSTAEGGPGIDMPAGPSEVLVIADAGADAEFVAADLLSQAEHGPDSQVLLLTDDDAVAQAVAEQVEEQLAVLPRADIAAKSLGSSAIVVTQDLDEAFAISNDYAPEHLILALREPEDWLPKVERAGSVFLGDWAPETLGDYCSGTNHVLPTAGAARWTGGVNVASFQIAMTVQRVSPEGLAAVGPTAVELSGAEGLIGHQAAVTRRLARASTTGATTATTSGATTATTTGATS
ncbi:histidinol dehydrogenase [Ornithinimicrobium faecis]|uniref:Histidinol dehydrogenase n=1 Tax=Ornithinimicrobium faecis TaxID=2934158 RepID=A0ABY4YZ43_9MICO|nr:histidinol dehydrogenase [Ornithinimicrobium sp. HY1793]USQ82027.1 histidinol dehydrogenase [Ornithinimicrobium sp. HY1793]